MIASSGAFLRCPGHGDQPDSGLAVGWGWPGSLAAFSVGSTAGVYICFTLYV